MYGKMLIERTEEMETAEFLDTLNGLIDQGYVISNKVNIQRLRTSSGPFSASIRPIREDLRDAMNPGREREQERSAGAAAEDR